MYTNQPKGLLLCSASTSAEENSEFLSISADGTRCLFLCLIQVEIPDFNLAAGKKNTPERYFRGEGK